MKNSVFIIALPVTLISGFLLTGTDSKKSVSIQYTTLVSLQFTAGPDTLRPDPICNMKVDDKKDDTIHYNGYLFGFCSKSCRAEFVKNPDTYLPKKKN